MPLRSLPAVFAALLLSGGETPLPETVVKDARLVQVFAADLFFEGPTWDPKGKKLYFTAFGKGNQQILRLDAPGKAFVWMDQTQGVNGTCLSRNGRLLGAQAYGHCVVSYAFGKDGPADPMILVADDKLNQPNDVCQAPGGDVYFTDP